MTRRCRPSPYSAMAVFAALLGSSCERGRPTTPKEPSATQTDVAVTQALSVAVRVRARGPTGDVERESMAFTTVRVGGMSLAFTVRNGTDRVVDPGLSESVLLVNGEPLDDWPFIVGNGPRDERWQQLPPGEQLTFTYGMGDYFAKTGHYRVQLVLGDTESNVAEISVSPHCR